MYGRVLSIEIRGSVGTLVLNKISPIVEHQNVIDMVG